MTQDPRRHDLSKLLTDIKSSTKALEFARRAIDHASVIASSIESEAEIGPLIIDQCCNGDLDDARLYLTALHQQLDSTIRLWRLQVEIESRERAGKGAAQ